MWIVGQMTTLDADHLHDGVDFLCVRSRTASRSLSKTRSGTAVLIARMTCAGWGLMVRAMLRTHRRATNAAFLSVAMKLHVESLARIDEGDGLVLEGFAWLWLGRDPHAAPLQSLELGSHALAPKAKVVQSASSRG